MADIFQHFPVNASAQDVFEAVSTPVGLDSWWSQSSSGKAGDGEEYELGFGPGYYVEHGEVVAYEARLDA